MEVNQPDIFDVNIDTVMIFKKLKYVQQMLWANPIPRFINKLYIEMESVSQCNFSTWRLDVNK